MARTLFPSIAAAMLLFTAAARGAEIRIESVQALRAALQSPSSDSVGTTLVLSAGTFDIGEISLTSRGPLAIRGAGIGKTILLGQFTLRKTKGISFADLTLAGAADDKAESRRTVGIDAKDSSELSLARLHITRFTDGALQLERLQTTSFDDCTFDRVTYNEYAATGKTPAKMTTAILLSDMTDLAIRYCSIDTTERGGRGIGTFKESWSEKTPWADPPTSLTRVEIAHCTIKVDQWHAWNVPGTSTHPPQMTIELWHACSEDVVIHHCWLNNNVSLSADKLGKKPLAEKTIRMHHNRFELIPTTQNYRYAVEPYVTRFEFYHNLVVRGIYPLATWGKTASFEEVKIHHNVFYGTGDSQAVMNMLGMFPNLAFAHNTVYLLNKQTAPLATFANGEEKNTAQRVLNNLFLSMVDQTQPTGFSLGAENNGFLRVPVSGKNSVTGDFLLVAAGAMPYPFFSLASEKSVAVDKGQKIPGLNDKFAGKAPDLGAFEFGGAPWHVGPNRPPVVSLSIAQKTAEVLEPIEIAAGIKDDGVPTKTVKGLWSATPGSGAVFADPDAPSTTVRFKVSGRWILKFVADDGDQTGTAESPVVIKAKSVR